MESPEQPDPQPHQEPEKAPDVKRQGWVPRPPQSTSPTDFIVTVFAITVATILLILTVGVVLAGIFGADIKSYFAILTSIVTSVISALVGYLAGKGQGRIEEQQQQRPPDGP